MGTPRTHDAGLPAGGRSGVWLSGGGASGVVPPVLGLNFYVRVCM